MGRWRRILSTPIGFCLPTDFRSTIGRNLPDVIGRRVNGQWDFVEGVKNFDLAADGKTIYFLQGETLRIGTGGSLNGAENRWNAVRDFALDAYIVAVV